VKLPQERITSREGINAAQAFFERNGCVFQEVAQQNDFGKDAYVDIGQRGVVTFLCAALQVKSGTSYRTAKGDYFIPVENHSETWRRSTIPVFGLVYDPDDRLIRWADLTAYLRAKPDQNGGRIPVSSGRVLTLDGLRGEFAASLRKYADGGFGGITLRLLSAPPIQTDAVYDAWALGRHDAKYLLIIRRLILDLQLEALRRAIVLLSHAGLHPDIFFTSQNWIPPRVKENILPTFRWSPEEIVQMIRAVDPEDWGRGTLGQCVDVLLSEDANLVSKLHIVIDLMLEGSDTTQAIRAATLAVTHSPDQRHELSFLIKAHPALMNDEWFQEVFAAVNESGDLSLY
jgi:Domain of unknown function (DUF4365)